MTSGVILNLVGVDPIRGLLMAAIFNGRAAPPIILPMLLASRADPLGRWRSGPVLSHNGARQRAQTYLLVIFASAALFSIVRGAHLWVVVFGSVAVACLGSLSRQSD